MSSNLRVNNILPSVGTNVAIGTAGGSVTLTGTTFGTFSGDLTGNVNSTGVTTVTNLTATNITVGTAGTAITTVSVGASVGIGSTLPQIKLDVVGGIKGVITQMTSQVSTAGTSIDFTGIPSWAKRVTVMFNGVSTNGTSATQVQLGSTTFSTTGYSSSAGAINSGTGQLGSTTGLLLSQGIPATSFISGSIFISLLASNVWVYSGTTLYSSSSGAIHMLGGNSPTLSGTLDRVRITTVNGTDTFDAGTINVMYEG